MEESKFKVMKQVDVLEAIDKVVLAQTEPPGAGLDIVVVTWSSNGDNLAQRDPEGKDVNVYGVFKGVSSNEYLIERDGAKYGVSEEAAQGIHFAEDSEPTCPAGVAGAINTLGKRIWFQTTASRGVINLGVVVFNVKYSNGDENEAELLDRIRDMAMDAHEEVYYEYSALTSDLDRLAYETSGQSVDTWIHAFKSRVVLDWFAVDRGEWSPPAVAFVEFVKPICEYRIVLPIGNNAIAMLGLENLPAPEPGRGYRDYSNTLVPLNAGDSAIGKEFYTDSDNGKIGLRVFGCDYHEGECGVWFKYYSVDLTTVMIKAPCFLACAASSSRIDNRLLRPAREFRDKYLKAFPSGKVLIDLYNAHTIEMWKLVNADPEMQKEAKVLLSKLVQLVSTWREKKPMQFDETTIGAIGKLAELMKPKASEEFQSSLDKVVKHVEMLQGLTLGQALLAIEEANFLEW